LYKMERISSPECLFQNGQQWANEYVANRRQNPKHKFSWRNDDCYQAVRKRLSEMTKAHCAFCDGQIGVESRETVEHFRPKSKFPELAYEWENLFPCCDMCQSKKLELFEEGLLRPDHSDFVFERYFVANYKTGEIKPSPHADEQAQFRAEITIRLYGLDLPARNKARQREWERYCRDPEPCIDDYNYRFLLVNFQG